MQIILKVCQRTEEGDSGLAQKQRWGAARMLWERAAAGVGLQTDGIPWKAAAKSVAKGAGETEQRGRGEPWRRGGRRTGSLAAERRRPGRRGVAAAARSERGQAMENSWGLRGKFWSRFRSTRQRGTGGRGETTEKQERLLFLQREIGALPVRRVNQHSAAWPSRNASTAQSSPRTFNVLMGMKSTEQSIITPVLQPLLLAALRGPRATAQRAHPPPASGHRPRRAGPGRPGAAEDGGGGVPPPPRPG